MRIKILLAISITIFLSVSVFAQRGSVSIVPNKTTYKRTGKNLADHKKTFEVTYPKISGLKSGSAKQNLLRTIDYWKNFDTTLGENLGDYYWLDSFSYHINYKKNSVLGIQLIMEGSGAYPDQSVKTFVIDLRNGKRVQIGDVFANIGKLLVKIDKAQKTEIKKAMAEAKREGGSINGLIKSGDFTRNKLEEFSISDKGVTFLYDYGFPHAVQALEPDGEYFFSWAEIRPFIRSGSLLAKFIN